MTTARGATTAARGIAKIHSGQHNLFHSRKNNQLIVNNYHPRTISNTGRPLCLTVDGLGVISRVNGPNSLTVTILIIADPPNDKQIDRGSRFEDTIIYYITEAFLSTPGIIKSMMALIIKMH